MLAEELRPIEQLLSAIESSNKKYDLEKIKKAILYADEMHKGQMRQSGEPYISHPIAVAESVVSLGLDTDSVCAALLHDTVEDCPEKTNLDAIRQLFGNDVALFVDGVTKIKSINVEDKEETHIENIRKMLLAMAKERGTAWAKEQIEAGREYLLASNTVENQSNIYQAL